MFRPLSLAIAARYLGSKRQHHFANLVSLFSVLGIALGVAALVIVLSVMNGFEREVIRHVLAMTAHGVLVPPSGHLKQWPALLEGVSNADGVLAASPYVRGSALVSRRGSVQGVAVEGISATHEQHVTNLRQYLRRGDLASLLSADRQVLIGAELARSLDLVPGDALRLLIPRWSADGQAQSPRYERLQVAGIFSVGMHQYDSKLLVTSLTTAQQLFELENSISGIRIKFEQAESAPLLIRQLARSLNEEMYIVDWTQYHRNFFLALKSQKRMMFVVLILIVAVAAFNIAANMVMLVSEKTRDIAILRTLGASRSSIVAVFLFNGVLIGLLGALFGALLGAWGCAESEAFAQFIERLLGIDLINSDVYFIDYLPADLRWPDVFSVTAAALALALIATLYPALKAASVNPAVAVHRD